MANYYEITNILMKLHSTTGLPRLEIEGFDESIEAQYLGFFRHPTNFLGKRAVYVLNDFYDESGGGSYNDWDYIIFPKSALEILVEKALDSKLLHKARHTTSGIRITFKEYWNAQGEGWASPQEEKHIDLSLSLIIIGSKPHLSIKYQE